MRRQVRRLRDDFPPRAANFPRRNLRDDHRPSGSNAVNFGDY